MPADVPDHTAVSLIKATDTDGNVVSVLLDASGAIVAVMKGDYEGALKTMRVDSEGYLVARLQGKYGETYRDLIADEDGRLAVSEISQVTVSKDTVEAQTWTDPLTSLLSNLNRIRHQIVAITGETWGTVTNPLTDYTLKSLFNANTILYATTDNTPVALEVAASRILGRKAAGGISAMTEAELRALLSLEAADIPDLPATKITSGDLAAARMSANIVAAIAGLDPTFTSLTFDSAIQAIKRNVDDSYLNLAGSSTSSAGAYISLRGGDAPFLGEVYHYIGDYRAGKTPDAHFTINYLSDETTVDVFVIDKSGNIRTAARGDFSAGVKLGTSQDANHFDDGSHGAASTLMYIGNKTINTTFTASHYYKLGDFDLQVGELVKLIDHKIYRSDKLMDKAVCGIFWGITDYKDSLGNVYLKNQEIEEEYNDENDLEEVSRSEAIEEVKGKERIEAGKKKVLIENKKTKKLEIIEVPDFVEVETGAFVERLKPLVSFDEKAGEFMKPKRKLRKAITNNPIRVSDGQPATPMDFAYAVAVLGDSFEDHDKNPLPGAWVTIDAGIMEEGDYLCSSLRTGYLEKQGDNIRYDYTKAIAREKITADTMNAYVELV